MEEASVMHAGLGWDRIRQAISVVERQGRGNERTLQLAPDYDVANVSEKIVRILLSYTDYVNSNVRRGEEWQLQSDEGAQPARDEPLP
jgi:UDP-N-acetyl-L-fucosamine synthase